MTPLDAINEWFGTQTKEIQADIAFFLSMNLFDNEKADFSSSVEDLKA